ncbi:hypothetical protein [Aquipuribacter nitratireducens]|uniref:Uncharacterized protein n=1 Tax=Aquipuribacter nitratireducens TaxID=650104 RepID=A0ABW0GV76_9MICO
MRSLVAGALAGAVGAGLLLGVVPGNAAGLDVDGGVVQVFRADGPATVPPDPAEPDCGPGQRSTLPDVAVGPPCDRPPVGPPRPTDAPPQPPGRPSDRPRGAAVTAPAPPHAPEPTAEPSAEPTVAPATP